MTHKKIRSILDCSSIRFIKLVNLIYFFFLSIKPRAYHQKLYTRNITQLLFETEKLFRVKLLYSFFFQQHRKFPQKRSPPNSLRPDFDSESCKITQKSPVSYGLATLKLRVSCIKRFRWDSKASSSFEFLWFSRDAARLELKQFNLKHKQNSPLNIALGPQKATR